MTQDFLAYTAPSLTAEDAKAITKAFKSETITRGPLVQEFEQALADECGAKYAVVFNSGTSALEAAFFACKASPYDRIITSPNTFIGTITGALKRNSKVTLVDIDPKTGNLDLSLLEEEINQPSSRGREIIVPVHYAGIAIDIESIRSSIMRPDTIIIEDAAHAFGSTYPNGSKVGCCELSDMTIFSFHPAKQFTTGEGGAVLTNDPHYYERLKLFRNNGIVPKGEFYEVVELSGNYNFTEFQAALGLSQLSRVKKMNEARSKLIKTYRRLLQDIPSISLMPEELDERTSYHLFVIRTPERDRVRAHLKEQNIGSQVHYIPLYRHPVLRLNPDCFPNMETFFAEALSLPLHAGMEESDVERVVDAIRGSLAGSGEL